MIDAKQALVVADTEARSLGWGEISADDYNVLPFERDGRKMWDVGMILPVIGHRLKFTIDAGTGQIVDKRKFGPR